MATTANAERMMKTTITIGSSLQSADQMPMR
jgi:hypothetical protein